MKTIINDQWTTDYTDKKIKPKMKYKHNQYYVGVKYPTFYHADIFRDNPEMVTPIHHNNLYAFCFGGYTTMRKAVEVAMYQNYVIDTPQGKSKIYS